MLSSVLAFPQLWPRDFDRTLFFLENLSTINKFILMATYFHHIHLILSLVENVQACCSYLKNLLQELIINILVNMAISRYKMWCKGKRSNYKTLQASATETAAGITDKRWFCTPATFNVSEIIFIRMRTNSTLQK